MDIHIQTPKLTSNSVQTKRDEIKQSFLQTYDLYEKLFETIKDEKTFYIQPNRLRHPLIFYYAHTAVFFINKLTLKGLIPKRINNNIEALCAIGVDEMSWDDMSSSNYNWPTFKEVQTYRNEVKQTVLHLIDTIPMHLPISWDSDMWIVLMGIEHERIHIETSSVLIRELPLELVRPHEMFPICQNDHLAPTNKLVKIKAKTLNLGKPENHELYGWDNEYGSHIAKLQSFEASKYLVSNAEFMEFVTDNGYTHQKYWSDEGWEWVSYTRATHPVFWRYTNSSYKLRTMTHEIELPQSWPVEVNAHEAEAFCRYKSLKTDQHITLPSEDEYMSILDEYTSEDIPKDANINLSKYASPCPVDEHKHNNLYDIVGNVWQWSSTAMYPYDGFEVHPIYDDFTTPTFDNKHSLIKGGSWISTGNEATKHARYAFRKHFFQHAGFRYVQSNNKSHQKNIYESDTLVSQYCDFQYGDEYFGVANFAKRCADIATQYSSHTDMQNALDLGCTTGRASFELSKSFEHVTGIDFSARFVQVASKLSKDEPIIYSKVIEGDIKTKHQISLKSLNIPNNHNVVFWQGDACNLKNQFTNYDLIMATNLIDRLYNPKLFLENIHTRINPQGILVLTSPYTWLEEYTKKAYWLGGYCYDGKNISTIDTLRNILAPHFKLITTQDVEFVIPESARKYQHTISHMSIWQKI